MSRLFDIRGEIARIQIPPADTCLEPAVQFIASYAREIRLKQEKQEALKNACQVALSLVLERNRNGKSDEPIVIEVGHSEGRLSVSIQNRGVPILSGQTVGEPGGGDLIEEHHEAFRNLDSVSLENLGRHGQCLVLEVEIGKEAAERILGEGERNGSRVTLEEEEIVVRLLIPGEETALSQLFYQTYGYNYINESVYYPERIKAMIEEGKLVCVVAALPDGRLVGHAGLLKWQEAPPVYEAALGLVDPAIKSRGLFKRIFEMTLEEARRIPMQYLLFDFVTNHDYSQRLINRYGTREMALFIGCQSKTTQARLEKIGIGEDPKDMDRYTILLSVLPMVEHPFGRKVLLPSSLGEPLGFLLPPLQVDWVPAPRFDPLLPAGSYKAQYQSAQGSVIFDLADPGMQAVREILKEWQELLRNGYQYAGVEVPLEASGIGVLYDMLAEAGFFVSGFVPYRLSERLGFRFQAIGPTKVAFDKIRVHSEAARRLLDIIRNDYETNRLM